MLINFSAMYRSVLVFLVSVSLSPYKVALRKPCLAPYMVPEAPPRILPGLFGEVPDPRTLIPDPSGVFFRLCPFTFRLCESAGTNLVRDRGSHQVPHPSRKPSRDPIR